MFACDSVKLLSGLNFCQISKISPCLPTMSPGRPILRSESNTIQGNGERATWKKSRFFQVFKTRLCSSMLPLSFFCVVTRSRKSSEKISTKGQKEKDWIRKDVFYKRFLFARSPQSVTFFPCSFDIPYHTSLSENFFSFPRENGKGDEARISDSYRIQSPSFSPSISYGKFSRSSPLLFLHGLKATVTLPSNPQTLGSRGSKTGFHPTGPNG